MTSVVRQIFETYSPLKTKNLRLYLGGQWFSLVGTWMQNAAQAWLVWELTHSAAALGVVGMLSLFPFLVIGPFSGVIADRVDRRILLIRVQIVCMLLALVLAVLVGTHSAKLWHVYALATILGCMEALGLPTQQAFLGDLAGVDQMRKVVVINNTIFQVSRMVGPPLASLATKWIGMASAFWLNGLSFLAVIWSLKQIQVLRAQRESRTGGWQDFLEGFRFVRENIRVQYLFVFTLFMTLFGFSNFQILAAFASVSLHGDFSTYGSLMGASGIGALIGVLILVPQTHRMDRIGWVLSLACSFTGVCFVILAFTQSIPLAMVWMFLGSLSFPVVMVNINGLVQTIAPPGIRARVVSLWLILGFGVQPFASLLVGYYAHLYGPSAAIGLNGVLMVTGAGLMTLFRPQFRYWRVRAAA